MSVVDNLRVGRTKRRAAYLAAAALLSLPCLASADEVFKATAGVAVPGWPPASTAKVKNVSFDISFVDPLIHTYVLGDRTTASVDVVNTHDLSIHQLQANPPFAGATGNNNTSGPDGVVIVHHSEVWVGDGPTTTCTPALAAAFSPACSTVKVLDLNTGFTTHVIPTGGQDRADEECFDEADNLVMVANNADTPPFGSIMSASTYKVVHQVSFTWSTNGAEQCAWSPRTGKFYITIPGINTPDNGTGEVDVIEPTTGAVLHRWPIDPTKCNTPQGMAVGPDHQIMVGCNNTALGPVASGIIIDDRDGDIIATIPNESGPDEVWYNEGDGQYFLARSSAVGSIQFLGVVDARDPDNGDTSIALGSKPVAGVGGSAHSVAADSETRRVFVPIPNGLSTCSQVGLSDASGCIAVFTAKHDDRPDPIVRHHDDDDDFARRDDDDHDHH
jgi:hypothetical protein